MGAAGAAKSVKFVHRCTECSAAHPKWAGRCPACGAWNSLVEDVEVPTAAGTSSTAAAPARQIGDVDADVAQAQPSGIGELDRVLGGGLVPGSVTLLGGEPGIGKSTLLLQLLAWWPGRALYVSAEESAQQVRLRAERLSAVRDDLWVLAETDLGRIVAAIDELAPSLVIVDSIQTVADASLGSSPGTVVQVRGCAQQLVQVAKLRHLPIVLVGHVTKDGSLAGPRALEHVVDTVLAFEGERHHSLRLLRATKHRYGPTDDLGLFEMRPRGLQGVPDASWLFLADRHQGVPGSVVVPTLDGQRPLLLEVQALTNLTTNAVPPRRTALGLDPGRLALLLAVLERRAGMPVGAHEVYTSVVGGVRLTEPGADLGICCAIVSAISDRPLPADLVIFGEVGLAGELRQVTHSARRLAEAARLGFTRALVPASAPDGIAGIHLERATTLAEALSAAGLARVQGTPPPRY